MRRFAIFAMLVLTCGQAFADITLLLGPDGQALPNGVYRLLIIPTDATKLPVNTIINVGGGVAPTPPIPPLPEPDTIDAKLTLLLAAVDDQDRTITAGKLRIAYETTLQLTANSITDANSLRGVMAGVEKGVLDSLKKTAGWKPWTDGLAEIVKSMDFSQCLVVYNAAVAKLGGGPSPPPVPPPPVTAAVKAVILIESENQTAEQASIINQLRDDKAWSKLVKVSDPNQKLENNQPDPKVLALVQAVVGRPLPRLVGVDAQESWVFDVDLPQSLDSIKSVLTGKGVKP